MSLHFSSIIVPLDGSPEAVAGLNFALQIARGNTRLHLCSVVNLAAAGLAAAAGTGIAVAPYIDVLEREAREICERAVATAAGPKFDLVDTRVLYGQPAPAIGDYATEMQGGAIVLGTRANTGFKRALLGSVTEELLRIADVPVVITHIEDTHRSGPILVAVDESAAAGAAFRLALDQAASTNADLIVLHVMRQSEHPPHDQSFFDAYADQARAAGVTFELTLLRGDVIESIIAAAVRAQCSAIFLGTHGRPAFARLALGSVAAGVLERARIPVVVTRRA